ncbi:MAG: alpha/beta fold hydrolase [Gammaproteobacteria bacterium]
MSDSPSSLAPPRRRALLLESRTAVDLARMVGPLVSVQLRRPVTRVGARVIVVPGFGSDDRYTAPLRHYLNRLGFRAEGWGLGKNMAGVDLAHSLEDLSPGWQFAQKEDYRGEGSVPFLADRLADRVRERYAVTDEPITLIGWSLGGYLAREVARDLPEIVNRVITMGSPTIGGPKYTAAAPFFRKRGMDLDWIEEQISRREERPIRQPITAIFSRNDAVVSWQAAIDHHSENVTHVEVSAPHLGMGFNPTIWRHIVSALKSDSAIAESGVADAG